MLFMPPKNPTPPSSAYLPASSATPNDASARAVALHARAARTTRNAAARGRMPPCHRPGGSAPAAEKGGSCAGAILDAVDDWEATLARAAERTRDGEERLPG